MKHLVLFFILELASVYHLDKLLFHSLFLYLYALDKALF